MAGNEGHGQVRVLGRKLSYGNVKQRVNSWIELEETFLFGAVIHKYLSQGSLFTPRTADDKEKGNSEKSSVMDCWNEIKSIYDLIWLRYTKQNPTVAKCSRTASALQRHYKVMKGRLSKPGGENTFHDLYDKWSLKYNKNSCLLGNIAVGVSGFQPEMPSDDRLFSRINSWTQEEEVVLVGTVLDRFLDRGSLVSARRNRPKSEMDEDCWSTIKTKYDMAWETLIKQKIVKERKSERTMNALSRHYKVMKSRISASNGKEHLSVFFDKWRKFYLGFVRGNKTLTPKSKIVSKQETKFPTFKVINDNQKVNQGSRSQPQLTSVAQMQSILSGSVNAKRKLNAIFNQNLEQHVHTNKNPRISLNQMLNQNYQNPLPGMNSISPQQNNSMVPQFPFNSPSSPDTSSFTIAPSCMSMNQLGLNMLQLNQGSPLMQSEDVFAKLQKVQANQQLMNQTIQNFCTSQLSGPSAPFPMQHISAVGQKRISIGMLPCANLLNTLSAGHSSSQ